MNLTHEPDADLSTQQGEAILNALNFQPPCDGRFAKWPHHETCDNGAVWQALLTCNCTRLWCDEHKRLREQIEGQRGEFMCGTCTQSNLEPVWAKIEFVGPLSAA